MENSNCENGVVARIAVGYRFRPSDEELVIHYLRRKVFSLPLSAPTLIPELDVFNSNPWDLPGDLKERRYFFSKIEKDVLNKSGMKYRSGCGYWKPYRKDKQVVASQTNIVIAIRKSFIFYKGKSIKTQWIMRQVCLVDSFYASNDLTQKLMLQVGDWVVCCLYQSKNKANNGVQRSQLTSRN